MKTLHLPCWSAWLARTSWILAAASVLSGYSALAKADGVCQQITVPVTLSPVDPTLYNVVGFLCGEAPRRKTVQLLLSGATYGHVYWDFPLQPSMYSYVLQANQAGYATFNIDRIGIGLSDHPVPELITLETNAYVAHQIVQQLRSGAIGKTKYHKVILTGHSLGSIMAVKEAAEFQDVDGLILSAFVHYASPAVGPLIGSDLYPAFLDPRFSPTLAPGYLTTIPGTRQDVFYYTPNADPAVIAEDEATKETVTDAELGSAFPEFSSPESLQIHVPVLTAVGEHDAFYCGQAVNCDQAGITANETPFYSADACLQVNVIQNSAHDLNLHLNAGQWFSIATQWADEHIGSHGGRAPGCSR